jgi:hypothetical protein
MKKVVLLGSFLVLFCASPGMAAAQSLDGRTDPLEDVVDEVTNPVDKVKEVIDEVKKPVEKGLPSLADPVRKPVEDIGKAVDKVVKGVTDVAKNPSGVAESPAGGGSDALNPDSSVGGTGAIGGSKADGSASGASATRATAARASGGSAKVSKGNSRPERDTEQVVAAGNTIEPGEVRGTQIVASASDGDEGEGSGLSITGLEILTWLILACGLLAAGAAFVRGGRMRVRTISS